MLSLSENYIARYVFRCEKLCSRNFLQKLKIVTIVIYFFYYICIEVRKKISDLKKEFLKWL